MHGRPASAEVVNYACEDADITLQLAEVLLPKLAAPTNWRRCTGTWKCCALRAHAHEPKVCLDTDHLSAFSAELTQLEALQASIKHAGDPFNVDSPKQLGDVLFDHLEIPAKVKKTKTGQYPTSEAVLSKLKDAHPIVSEVLEYRS